MLPIRKGRTVRTDGCGQVVLIVITIVYTCQVREQRPGIPLRLAAFYGRIIERLYLVVREIGTRSLRVAVDVLLCSETGDSVEFMFIPRSEIGNSVFVQPVNNLGGLFCRFSFR